MRDKVGAPIGMLDSGLGGLTVLHTAVKHLPHERFVYYADFKHSPFGGRSKGEVIEILTRVVDELVKRPIKALVFASNTATSAAVETFRASLAIPVIGLEPALKPAVQTTPRGKVLVLATELTLREEKFNRLYESYKDQADVILKSCPGLVEIIDGGIEDEAVLEAYLTGLFSDLDKTAIRTVVLGCTHYVIVKDAILRCFPEGVRSVDGNEGVVRQLEHVLQSTGLLAPADAVGGVEWRSSDEAKLPLLRKQFVQLG